MRELGSVRVFGWALLSTLATTACGSAESSGEAPASARWLSEGVKTQAATSNDRSSLVGGGFLHTEGRHIVDSSGRKVRLTGISWFGMETSNMAPHGLWSRTLDSMLDQVRDLGFNMLRIPYTNQMFDAGAMPAGIDYYQNPSLQGLRPIEVLDRVIAGAGARGLRVVLDRHRPEAGGQAPLWYTPVISEQRWIEDWRMLAKRYAGNPTVIGVDLHNEPHGDATWGEGDETKDWRAAAERAGEAVLKENPDLLIIVEGIERYRGTSYWWGGNLRGVADAPVRLSVPHRVVYSPHDYPVTVAEQAWFHDANYPNNLPSVWDDAWGFIAKKDIAPIWIGEFGTKLEAEKDKKWLDSMGNYIRDHGLSFAYWCLNPNSGDTGGILWDDWKTVRIEKMAVVQRLLEPVRF